MTNQREHCMEMKLRGLAKMPPKKAISVFCNGKEIPSRLLRLDKKNYKVFAPLPKKQGLYDWYVTIDVDEDTERRTTVVKTFVAQDGVCWLNPN